MTEGKIIKVTWPLVVADGLPWAKMYEVVKVSNSKLLWEIIRLDKDKAFIQVYEDTAWVWPWEPVVLTWDLMSVELAPWLLESIYDWVQRPLKEIEKASKSYYIKRWIEVPWIDRNKKWDFVALAKSWDQVVAWDIIWTVQETVLIEHKIMVPYWVSGKIKSINSWSFNVEEIIAVIETWNWDYEVKMLQKWPIRRPRYVKTKKVPNIPLITWGRSIDTFFPLVKWWAWCIPWPFGSWKTVTQQALAKYCDAQVIVYIWCWERWNEMTEVLKEFPHLKDPNSWEPLMKRTIMIANTSNMPVAAREASIYVWVTIAEYYRDMWYSVALMADSTSRWAEALREISWRLEEMPWEEWYPAYLWSRTAEFYERAWYVECLWSTPREWALTLVWAVSPPWWDLSEPVTQNTLRVTKCYWWLDAKLSYKRHFPAINWLSSYSLYVENIIDWWKVNVAEDFPKIRSDALSLLAEEAKLEEIVRLVWMEALSWRERLVMFVSKSIREDFLFQNAFDPDDAYMVPKRCYGILKAIMWVYYEWVNVIWKEWFEFKNLENLEILKKLTRAKDITLDKFEEFELLEKDIREAIKQL